MNKWSVHEENGWYKFQSKAHDGIDEIDIYVFNTPENRGTETRAKTHNLDTYKKILKEGKQHATEKNEALPVSKETYYFNSTDISFGRMIEAVREGLFTDSRLRNHLLENPLSHYEPFAENDRDGWANSITNSLSVLAKADKNVEEIIDYIKEQITPKSSLGPK